MILAVGYRVRSPRGVQFRRWATKILSKYLIKGFAMNDERLKEPGGLDYFDELLERIREIRASEMRFYQKVRDLFAATSADYDAESDTAQTFFSTIQNKLVYAATGSTAAELIFARADPAKPNMALTSWKGSRSVIVPLGRRLIAFVAGGREFACRGKNASFPEILVQPVKASVFFSRLMSLRPSRRRRAALNVLSGI